MWGSTSKGCKDNNDVKPSSIVGAARERKAAKEGEAGGEFCNINDDLRMHIYRC